MPSRSASAPGEGDHWGGTIGSASVPGRRRRRRRLDPPEPSIPAPGPRSSSTASASRSTVSVTHGGTCSPVARSAEVASTSVWLTLSTAISCMSRRDRPLGRSPAGEHRVVRLVQRGGERLMGVGRPGRADRPQVGRDRVVDVGDRLPLRAPRREQEAGRDQQQRPRHPDAPLQRGVPPRPQRAQRPEPERAVDEQLQAGHRAHRAEPRQHRRHPGQRTRPRRPRPSRARGSASR